MSDGYRRQGRPQGTALWNSARLVRASLVAAQFTHQHQGVGPLEHFVEKVQGRRETEMGITEAWFNEMDQGPADPRQKLP